MSNEVIIDGRTYVETSLSEQINQHMKSGKHREYFGEAELKQALAHISHALLKLGPIVDETQFVYSGILYHPLAPSILELSRSDYWTGHDIDGVLEGLLKSWLKETKPNYDEFMKTLFEAIYNLECIQGVLLRLNFDAVSQPAHSRTIINTRFGTITKESEPRHQVLLGTAREEAKRLLSNQKQFSRDLNHITNGLRSIHQTYTLEQTLISWMGYIILRAIIESTSIPIRIVDQRVLMDKESSVKMLPPSPTDRQ